MPETNPSEQITAEGPKDFWRLEDFVCDSRLAEMLLYDPDTY
jgi:hypothetical protein